MSGTRQSSNASSCDRFAVFATSAYPSLTSPQIARRGPAPFAALSTLILHLPPPPLAQRFYPRPLASFLPPFCSRSTRSADGRTSVAARRPILRDHQLDASACLTPTA